MAKPESAWGKGRSPRVRGSRLCERGDGTLDGSIPACAGEPRRRARRWAARWVDPRVCGGAVGKRGLTRSHKGRSPRVRGSHLRPRHGRVYPGSIPACAGEPLYRPRYQSRHEVDPRVCGGAPSASSRPEITMGRSPRVRGSRGGVILRRQDTGSIPACAGEPSRPTGASTRPKVDPRVCGGAIPEIMLIMADGGRSPRVRGSRGGARARGRREGSIPACAGEPPGCCGW